MIAPSFRRRPSYSAREREAALLEANGLCHLCGLGIAPGQAWEMSHVGVPHALGGDMVRPAHARCHAVETAEITAPLVAKTRRLRQKHNGAREKAFVMPGNRKTPWKKKLGGGVERRDAPAAREQAWRENCAGLDFSRAPISRRFSGARENGAGDAT